MTAARAIRLTLVTALWIGFVYSSAAILLSTLDFYTKGDANGFIVEKGWIGELRGWRFALYLHISGGLLCLASCLLQFIRPILRHAPWLHRWLGRVYVFSVLWLLCPAGFYLALFAKGGAWGTSGFLFLTVITYYTTSRGARALRRAQPDRGEHVRFMIRSFAMVASANTFRLYHTLFALTTLEYRLNYLLSLWLSILGNALLAELVIAGLSRRQQRTKSKHTIHHEPYPVPPTPSAPSPS